jgi:hypothetical protein
MICACSNQGLFSGPNYRLALLQIYWTGAAGTSGLAGPTAMDCPLGVQNNENSPDGQRRPWEGARCGRKGKGRAHKQVHGINASACPGRVPCRSLACGD